MRTVHVVDDIEIDRKRIVKLLRDSWGVGQDEDQGELEAPAEIKTWRFIWDLVRSPKLKSGDVVISDLYPEGYWEQVPPPTLYTPSRSLPDDPTNLYKATLDVIQRFMRVVPKSGAHLIVITYVPNWIEKELQIPVLAEKIRGVLDGEGFDYLEKNEQFEDDHCFQEAVDRARTLLENHDE